MRLKPPGSRSPERERAACARTAFLRASLIRNQRVWPCDACNCWGCACRQAYGPIADPRGSENASSLSWAELG